MPRLFKFWLDRGGLPARVDGASAWQRFRFIILPHLSFVILVATLLEGIWTFKHFDIVQVMTGGGPGRATGYFSVRQPVHRSERGLPMALSRPSSWQGFPSRGPRDAAGRCAAPAGGCDP